MIKKVLIANRGEIALRVMRSCREMGIRTVAVYSDADRTSRHVAYADEAYELGPAVAKESYLNIDKVLAVAKQCHADAIHPGYGFLSENADFARRCVEEGIVFIGPSAETMESMGDKIAARRRMIAAGVPVVPGTEEPLKSADEAVKICNEIGYPVMLKASMGGGGKGMRLIHSENEVVEAYNSAREESMSSFGDDTVYLEKFVEEPHHIEIQILGDNYGNVVHLFDRECSVQRRNQKIVEESPSPFLTPELRKEMGEKAVAAAKAVNYSGAGTIEFLVDKYRNFYFLEMNTRLQVEHTITEEVVGVDLVKEQ
ncbi:MAG: biotin carboxylase N-terminal domain-containing protein, partial [Prevotellaceae bacterium]|nr:biotin carboxylase N-terminal domain-containing protein [Prevotellaceae bacterium]